MDGLDRLWEENPRVQQTFAAGKAEGKAEAIAEGKAEGIAEGKIEGQLEGLRSAVEIITSARFPSLTELAHQKASSLTQLDALRQLQEHLVIASNEETARHLLLQQQPPS